MVNLKIKATKVLKKTLQAEKDGFKIICHEGGSRSSKTWSIFQFFLLKALRGDKISVTIVRDKLSWIRSTILKDFAELINLYGLDVTPEISMYRPDQIYYLSGSEFAFYGLDYPEKLHGRKQDWFWMNETMECAKSFFDQLEMRTHIGGVLDYNPANDEHWVFELSKRPDVTFIKSTMLDNPFLPKSVLNKIRSYEPTPENIERGTADNYMWEVYGLGNRARLQGAIFTNWDEMEDVPKDANLLGYGLDFGYTNNPTAVVALYMYNGELYVRELLYETGLTNQDIAQRLSGCGVVKSMEIYCDSAEPKSIDEIATLGFNAKPAVKGQDSINYGVDLLKSMRLHVCSSPNLGAELRKYKWAEDRTGAILNKPVKAFDHLIDATRYCAVMTLGSQKQQEADIDFY